MKEKKKFPQNQLNIQAPSLTTHFTLMGYNDLHRRGNACTVVQSLKMVFTEEENDKYTLKLKYLNFYNKYMRVKF